MNTHSGVLNAILNVLTLGEHDNPGSNARYWGSVADSFNPLHPSGAMNLAAFLMGPRGEFALPETRTVYTDPRFNGPADLGNRAFLETQLYKSLRTDGTATRKTVAGYPSAEPPSFRQEIAESNVRGALRPGVMKRVAPSLLAQMLANHLRAGRN